MNSLIPKCDLAPGLGRRRHSGASSGDFAEFPLSEPHVSITMCQRRRDVLPVGRQIIERNAVFDDGYTQDACQRTIRKFFRRFLSASDKSVRT
jgi:hypothetical protein